MAGKPLSRAKKKAKEEAKAKLVALTGSARKPRVVKPVSPELKAARDAGLTVFGHLPETWDKFLIEYVRTCQQVRAAETVGIPFKSVRHRADNDTDFNARVEEARKAVIQRLEDAGFERATLGVTRNVHYQGDVIDTVTEYSDSLLSFMLQANNDKYRKQQEVNLKGGMNFSNVTDTELDSLMKAKMEELAKLENGEE